LKWDYQKLKDVAESIRSKKHSALFVEDYKGFSELLIISLSSNPAKYQRLKEHHHAIVA
jgi:hypothetical protein